MSNEISRMTFRERYSAMLTHLRSQIMAGEWVPGEFIPPERVLIDRYQLSKPSVRKVLATLADEGLIQTLKGKGSIVREVDNQCTVLQLFWLMPSVEYPVIAEIVERFNKVHKHVKVEITQVSRSMISNSTTAEGVFLGKVKPDLIGVGDNYFLYMRSMGLHKFLQPIRHVLPGDIYGKISSAYKDQDELYAAPITFSPVVLAYNKSLFDKQGVAAPDSSWDWGDLLAAATALTERTGHSTERFGFGFATGMNRWPLFVLQNGGVFGQPENGEPDLRTIEALQFTVDLMYKHQVSPIYSTGLAAIGDEMFSREKVAMVLTSYMFTERFKDVDFQWDIAMFPGRNKDAAYGLASAIGVSSSCAFPEAAYTFIDYVLSDSMQAFIKLNSCSIPARSTIASSRKCQYNPVFGQTYYLFEQLIPHLKLLYDLGMNYDELSSLDKELALMWAHVEPVENVFSKLQAICSP